MIREILKMGDPRLLRIAESVEHFDTPELHALVEDMFDTMRHANGAGLAAPQIGVDLQVVIFGFAHNERYPDAEPVPGNGADQPHHHAGLARHGGRLGRVLVGAVAARCGAAVFHDPLSGFRSVRVAH
jgi:hypothetical protein